MRFIAMVKASADSEAGVLPTRQQLEEMGRFNEEMVKAGVMLEGEGLKASSQGARIRFTKGKPSVTDGPFTEAKELVAGFWLLQAKSKEEAVQWISRAPFEDAEVEIRPIFEAEDFGDALTPEMREAEASLRAQGARRS
ncbi:MAG: YciI family protein [Candidatus Eremiobacteraeota bacterium]|nr:YciI family protein [Candidatus Eremiobacteraeota bacterium]